jgi:hypothetical protein
MTRLGVFLAFFIAAFFVPAWPLLLLLAVLYLIAWMLSGGGDSSGSDDGDSPADPPPASPGGRWTNFTRRARRAAKPFIPTSKR